MTASTTPPVLFHYTTSSGLLGILESKKLWATHARFLNDAKELEYGLKFIRGVLATYPANAVLSAASARLEASRPAYFLACFCAVDDLLSQWRAYGGNATGYSLGFDSHFLPADHLVEVIYEPTAQDAAVRSVIDDTFRDSDEYAYTDEYHRLVLQAALLRLSIRLKHPTFKEEREWRLVYCLEDEHSAFDDTSFRAEFRTNGRLIVPYLQLTLPTKSGPWDGDLLHLKSVRIGPTANPLEARYALNWMLWRHGYTEAETTVCGSETSLRP